MGQKRQVVLGHFTYTALSRWGGGGGGGENSVTIIIVYKQKTAMYSVHVGHIIGVATQKSEGVINRPSRQVPIASVLVQS